MLPMPSAKKAASFEGLTAVVRRYWNTHFSDAVEDEEECDFRETMNQIHKMYRSHSYVRADVEIEDYKQHVLRMAVVQENGSYNPYTFGLLRRLSALQEFIFEQTNPTGRAAAAGYAPGGENVIRVSRDAFDSIGLEREWER